MDRLYGCRCCINGRAVNAHRTRGACTRRASLRIRPFDQSRLRPTRENKETPNNTQTYIGFENIAGYFRDELANIIYSEC